MDLKVVIMDEKLITQNIKEEIFRKEFERYFHILEEGLNKEPYKNLCWQKAQTLYNSIDEDNRNNLREFVRMIMIETITELLAYVDGIATFKGQEYPFELFCNGTKVSGSLQEYLLMEIEEEQS